MKNMPVAETHLTNPCIRQIYKAAGRRMHSLEKSSISITYANMHTHAHAQCLNYVSLPSIAATYFFN